VPRITIDRRSLLATAIVTAAASRAVAQAAPETIELWPAVPPGGSVTTGPEQRTPNGGVTQVSRPRLVVYRPAHPNGTAMIVIAGGGYARIEAGPESTPACQWLQSSGTTAFELIYRLPEDGWPALAPFQDGQRAMRLVRSRAAAFGIDAARIGVIGFSAGGHLGGMTAVRPAALLYPAVDAADTASARPDFAGLLYPVLTMMPPFDHTRSRREIVGLHPSIAESEAWSVERHVDADTPPTFLAQAADDPISPIDNSLMMFAALRAAHIPAALHVFQSGRHGWGMGRPGTEEQAWPALFTRWAQLNAFLPPLARDP
jgi:acetyl esterase/lipase